MKALNFIDLAVQTLILGLVVISSLLIAFTGSFDSIATVALYGALLLGPWQFVGSLITTLSKGLYLKWRVIHLLSCIGYFILLGVGVYFLSDFDGDHPLRVIGGVLDFAIPGVLAVFYYYITIKSFQLARASKVLNVNV